MLGLVSFQADEEGTPQPHSAAAAPEPAPDSATTAPAMSEGASDTAGLERIAEAATPPKQQVRDGLDGGASGPCTSRLESDGSSSAPQDGAEVPRPTRSQPIHLEDIDEGLAFKLMEEFQRRGLLEKFSRKTNRPSQSPPPGPKRKSVASSSAVAAGEQQHLCEVKDCRKTFNRPCELKKHMKRHKKPYGCTFSGCGKRFGSKNDWKRHENSQHFQLEVWKCDLPEKDGKSLCGRVCHRRDPFRGHLQRDHEMPDNTSLDKKVDSCRVGQHCDTRFWCGFCEVVVPLKAKGPQAWTERYNHIDDHLFGRNGRQDTDISNWKSIDPDSPGAEQSPSSDSDESTRPGSGRPRTAAREDGLRTTGVKRSHPGGDEERGAAKQPRQEGGKTNLHLICCQCAYTRDTVINPMCMNCQHPECSSCTRDSVTSVKERGTGLPG